ncbi:MAG: AMP-binding protein [Bryobacteraceae bacterium]
MPVDLSPHDNFVAMASRTLFNVLEEAAARYGSLPAMHQPSPGGKGPKYRTYDWLEYCNAAREVACGLRSLGVEKGDIVALHSETRAEFYIADLGTMGAGCIAAALYAQAYLLWIMSDG